MSLNDIIKKHLPVKKLKLSHIIINIIIVEFLIIKIVIIVKKLKELNVVKD